MNKEQIAYDKGYRVTKDGHLLNPKGRKIGCVNSARKHSISECTIRYLINKRKVFKDA